MQIKKLNKRQKEEAKEWLKSYNFVNICNKCNSMYGSDLKEKVCICPLCYSKKINKK